MHDFPQRGAYGWYHERLIYKLNNNKKINPDTMGTLGATTIV